ncbi:Nucleotide-binding universal stress protein, UspA family [Modicisalibacter ilicicola DSM 19980]|uniref:Nucleotide-binding universal stress protein, UspA family n=1 Tax=Modicisalibacter ilicicola DSM 19980 TaxID=1121942 RepID=A0A1M4SM66_9GAMM|nr:universal stress protein [Halomonas ilicicola]SHE33333.1 Nucleotide-binding universal stress protein, UspA family [Halomonas ilicicola DSM 19980]
MKGFKNILYVLGPQTNESSPSWKRAVSLAKNNQADLTLLRVLPEVSLSSYARKYHVNGQELQQKVLEHEDSELRRLLSLLEAECNASAELMVGKRHVEIIRAVQMKNIDGVIKETDATSWLDRFFGSDDMNLLRRCPCPVWLMKQNEKPDYRHIMAAVAFDGDDEDINDGLNEMILNLASSLSLSDFASLHVVNIYDVPEAGFVSLWVEQPDRVRSELFEDEYRRSHYKMRVLLDSLKENIGEEAYRYLSPISHVVKGIPDREIPRMAEAVKADLVVMGTVARAGIAGAVIGNTAEAILAQIDCSVLAIKPEGFVSPVS